jgi:hypothetical protein
MVRSVLDFNSFSKSLNESNEHSESDNNETFHIYYIVGEEAVHLYSHKEFNDIPKKQVHKESFDTEAEADAFEKGLKAAAGWNSVTGISEKEYISIKG